MMKKILIIIVFILMCIIINANEFKKIINLTSIDKNVGSGNANIDTDVLLKAISIVTSNGYGTIKINENTTLLINKYINLPSNIRFFSEGNGATLKFIKLPGYDTCFSIKNRNNIILDNLKIDCNSIDKRITALEIKATDDSMINSNIKIRNCHFQKNNIISSDMSLYIHGSKDFSTCNNIRIENCKFQDYFRGIVINGKTKDIDIVNNSFTNIKNGGVYVSCTRGYYCKNILVQGNTFSELGGLGYNGYPIYFSTNGDKSKNSNIRIIGNDIMGNFTYYDLEGTKGNADMIAMYDCEDSFVNCNSVMGGGDVGICLWRSNKVIVEDNIVGYNNTKGIAVYASSNCIVANNIVYNNCLYKQGLPYGYKRAGIFVHDYGDPPIYSNYNYLAGNRCFDDRKSREKTQDYGIYITKNNCYNFIGINLLDGNKKYSIVSCDSTTVFSNKEKKGLINCN